MDLLDISFASFSLSHVLFSCNTKLFVTRQNSHYITYFHLSIADSPVLWQDHLSRNNSRYLFMSNFQKLLQNMYTAASASALTVKGRLFNKPQWRGVRFLVVMLPCCGHIAFLSTSCLCLFFKVYTHPCFSSPTIYTVIIIHPQYSLNTNLYVH